MGMHLIPLNATPPLNDAPDQKTLLLDGLQGKMRPEWPIRGFIDVSSDNSVRRKGNKVHTHKIVFDFPGL